MSESVSHVLIIEDDRIQTKLIKKQFEAFSHRYILTTADSIAAAKKILSEEKIDVIVTDIFLTDGKGTEIVYTFSEIPVVVITARGNEKLAVQHMKAGAVDFILKGSEEFANLPKIVDDAVISWAAGDEGRDNIRLQYHMPVILDTMPDGIVVVDLNGEIVYANKSAGEILELKRDKILGAYYFDEKWENIDENGRSLQEKELPLYTALKEQKKVDQFEHRIRKRDNSGVKWLSVNAAPMFDRMESLIGALATFRDITSTKELQQEIEREQRFVNAIENTSDTLIISLDYEGRILRFNAACRKITGYGIDELEGKPIWDYLILENEKEDVKQVFYKLRDKSQANQFQNYWKAKNGEKHFIAWTNTTVHDKKGNFEYILGTGIDITESKRAEELRMQEMRNEIASLEQFVFKKTTGVTGSSYGQKPLKVSQPELFHEFAASFSAILDKRLGELTYKIESNYAKELQLLADTLGLTSAKPKDIIDIYTLVLQNKVKENNPAKVGVYKDEGRLLILELMGNLTSFYRKYYTGALGKGKE